MCFCDVVGGRRGREKGELGGEVREHAPHLITAETPKGESASVSR